MQMSGVGLVFGGIGAEAYINKQEKEAKAASKLKQKKNEKAEKEL